MNKKDDDLNRYGKAILGAVFCLGGIIFTAVSYNSASGGGEYRIWWGAVVVGLYLLITGWVEAGRAKDHENFMNRVSHGHATKEDWNSKGDDFLDLGRYDDALKLYDMALEIDPKYTNAWINKGIALYKLGKYIESIEAFDKAIEINPQDAASWQGKGNVFKKIGRTVEADAAFAKAKELGYSG